MKSPEKNEAVGMMMLISALESESRTMARRVITRPRAEARLKELENPTTAEGCRYAAGALDFYVWAMEQVERGAGQNVEKELERQAREGTPRMAGPTELN